MGEADRHIEYRDSGYRQPDFKFSIHSPVIMLMMANFTVFLFVKLLMFGNDTGDTSISPYFIGKLGSFLVPSTFEGLLQKPWSLLTYSFFHYSFLNLLGNMLWLWGFGALLQNIAGNKRTIPVYLYGALAGALVFITTCTVLKATNVFALFPLQGANAAVMCIAAAATTLAPNYRIFQQLGGGIPIWILTAVYVLIDLIGLGSSSAPLFAAHLGGGLMGFLFAISYKNGYDWSAWMIKLYNWTSGLFNPNKSTQNKAVKEKVFYNTGGRNPYHKTANITQERIDEILDKINQKGYSALNKEEKEILKRASEE
jgi:membrane associated rhomboid family serine protease